jgi:uncharacterized phage protein (TIGR02218 family)
MTAYPPALAAHLHHEITTVCHCWRVTRRDGSVLGFTDHDRPLTVGGVICRPHSGFSASEATQALGLAGDVVDVGGALSSDDLTDDDIERGLYDDATVETLLVNWRDPESAALLRVGTVGAITRRGAHFVAELKGTNHALDRVAGRRASRSCDAMLGDARCGFDLDQTGFRSQGTVLATQGARAVVVEGLAGFAGGWFAGGTVRWLDGPRAERVDHVAAHSLQSAGVVLTLQAADGPLPGAGNGLEVTAGCDKSLSTCKTKFGNALNFRGLPHLPGNDAAYGYVAQGAVFDGAPLVP